MKAKKFLSLFLSCVMCTAGAQIPVSASQESATIDLVNADWNGNINSFATENDEKAKFDEKGLTLVPGENNFLYVDISDDFIYNIDNENVCIKVGYYDDGYGSFAISYDADKSTEFVNLENTMELKYYTFDVPDAKLNNGLNAHDFRVGLWTPEMGMSCDEVTFNSVEVYKGYPTAPVKISAETGKVGNIFASEDEKKITLNLENITDDNFQSTVTYAVKDEAGETVESGTATKSVSNGWKEVAEENFENDTGSWYAASCDGSAVTYGVEAVDGHNALKFTSTPIWALMRRDFAKVTSGTIRMNYSLYLGSRDATYIVVGIDGNGNEITLMTGGYGGYHSSPDYYFVQMQGDPSYGEPYNLGKAATEKWYDIQMDYDFDKDIIKTSIVAEDGTQSSAQTVENIAIDGLQGVFVRVGWTEGYTVAIDDFSVFAQESKVTPVEIMLENDAYGTYTLDATVSSAGNNSTYTTSASYDFSIINSVEKVNNDFGTVTHFGHRMGDQKEITALAAQAGIGMIRDEMYWKDVEATTGTLDISGDAYLSAFPGAIKSAGMDTLMVMAYGHNSYGGEGYIPEGETNIAAFARYCKYIADTYPDVKNFEIWNEANEATFNPGNATPAEYTELLKAAAAAIRGDGTREATIVIGLASPAKLTDKIWIHGLAEAGAFNYADAVAVHPYQTGGFSESTYISDVNFVKNLLKDKNSDAEIWFTEIGWTTSDDATNWGVSEKEQAENLVKSYVRAKTDSLASKYFWYDFANDGNDLTNREHFFGLINTYSGIRVRHAAKPSYVAVAGLNNMLTDAVYDSTIELSDTANAYKFTFADETKDDVYVVWSTGNGEETVSIDATEGTMLYDMYTNASELNVANGKATITLGSEPCYIASKEEVEVGSVADKKFGKKGWSTIITDNFNRDSLSPELTGWGITQCDVAPTVSIDKIGNHKQAVKITNNGTWARLVKGIDSITAGKVNLSFSINYENLGTYMLMGITPEGNEVNILTLENKGEAHDGTNLCVKQGAPYDAWTGDTRHLGWVTPGEWYDFDVTIDLDADTIETVITSDGETVGTNVYQGYELSGLSSLYFGAGWSAGKAFAIDDFALRTADGFVELAYDDFSAYNEAEWPATTASVTVDESTGDNYLKVASTSTWGQVWKEFGSVVNSGKLEINFALRPDSEKVFVINGIAENGHERSLLTIGGTQYGENPGFNIVHGAGDTALGGGYYLGHAEVGKWYNVKMIYDYTSKSLTTTVKPEGGSAVTNTVTSPWGETDDLKAMYFRAGWDNAAAFSLDDVQILHYVDPSEMKDKDKKFLKEGYAVVTEDCFNSYESASDMTSWGITQADAAPTVSIEKIGNHKQAVKFTNNGTWGRLVKGFDPITAGKVNLSFSINYENLGTYMLMGITPEGNEVNILTLENKGAEHDGTNLCVKQGYPYEAWAGDGRHIGWVTPGEWYDFDVTIDLDADTIETVITSDGETVGTNVYQGYELSGLSSLYFGAGWSAGKTFAIDDFAIRKTQGFVEGFYDDFSDETVDNGWQVTSATATVATDTDNNYLKVDSDGTWGQVYREFGGVANSGKLEINFRFNPMSEKVFLLNGIAENGEERPLFTIAGTAYGPEPGYNMVHGAGDPAYGGGYYLGHAEVGKWYDIKMVYDYTAKTLTTTVKAEDGEAVTNTVTRPWGETDDLRAVYFRGGWDADAVFGLDDVQIVYYTDSSLAITGAGIADMTEFAGEITAAVTYKNADGYDKYGKGYVALYGNEGLLEVKSFDFTAKTAAIETTTYPITFSNTDGAKEIKIMLWDADSIEPLCSSLLIE